MLASTQADLHAESDRSRATGDEHGRDGERSESGNESRRRLRLAERCDEQHERQDHDEAFEQRAHGFTLAGHPWAVAEISPKAHLTVAFGAVLYNQLLI